MKKHIPFLPILCLLLAAGIWGADALARSGAQTEPFSAEVEDVLEDSAEELLSGNSFLSVYDNPSGLDDHQGLTARVTGFYICSDQEVHVASLSVQRVPLRI